MKLSVVIVSYNVKYYLAQCIESLERALKNINAEIIVCDNHSRDGSVAYLSRLYPHIHYIKSTHNLGFAKANNIAIKQSRGEYVLLLNPDTFVSENTITQILSFMDAHTDSGALGVRMLTAHGESAMESRRGIPSPMTATYKMCGLCERFPHSLRFGRYYMSYLGWNEPQQIEIVSGAFCMIRRKALDSVGLLDEDFFMYGEDIDLSYRILKGGFTNWYLPVNILHYKGESTQKSSFKYVHVFYKAMLIFFRKHYSNMSNIISIPVEVAICVKACWELIKLSARNTSKIMGLASVRRKSEPHYHFFISEKSRKECSRIAADNGLDSSFHIGTEQTLPKGHTEHSDIGQSAGEHVIVYDTSAYSFDKILKLISSSPKRNVILGTYVNTLHAIITPKDIFL